jgi:hypothetical protein
MKGLANKAERRACTLASAVARWASNLEFHTAVLIGTSLFGNEPSTGREELQAPSLIVF